MIVLSDGTKIGNYNTVEIKIIKGKRLFCVVKV